MKLRHSNHPEKYIYFNRNIAKWSDDELMAAAYKYAAEEWSKDQYTPMLMWVPGVCVKNSNDPAYCLVPSFCDGTDDSFEPIPKDAKMERHRYIKSYAETWRTDRYVLIGEIWQSDKGTCEPTADPERKSCLMCSICFKDGRTLVTMWPIVEDGTGKKLGERLDWQCVERFLFNVYEDAA